MTNKESYDKFCQTTYVPIYSKSWWLDAVCGQDNWDVWLYYLGNEVYAAMPYYMENRGDYKYITKAPLTQNNGIVFKYNKEAKLPAVAQFEEKVINAACEYIKSLNLDVYEQQYMPSFKNWQPFFWNNYTNMLRYTYVIEDRSKFQITSKLNAIVKKGERNSRIIEGTDKDEFYELHEKIFLKQGLKCPFSKELWDKLYRATQVNQSSKILYAVDSEDHVTSLVFLVWDDEKVYLLLGGAIPEYSKLDTYSYLIRDSIEWAFSVHKKFDFEGSMIKRIAKSFRDFGGIPTPYYRIRKVFNPVIVRKEAEDYIDKMMKDNGE